MVFNFIFNLLFPPKCVVCNLHGKWVCDDCWGKLNLIYTPICYRCSKLSPDFRVCGSCRWQTPITKFITCSHWQEPLKTLVYAFKYRRLQVITDKLASLLGDAWSKYGNQNEVLFTAVPLNYRRLWDRGFNQSQLLANKLARKFNLAYVPVLMRTKNTKPQFGLSKRDRLINIGDSFKLRSGQKSRIAHKIVVLVDDIVATGATINACAKVLKQNGAKEVWALVLAKA